MDRWARPISGRWKNSFFMKPDCSTSGGSRNGLRYIPPAGALSACKRSRPAALSGLFGTAWIYVGHESQVPNAGDYWTTWIGKERMIICRAEDGQVHVLYNRCPHRGTLICNNLHGNSGNKKSFRCSYHAWQFTMDGSLRNIPMKEGSEGIIDLKDPQLQMKRMNLAVLDRQATYDSLPGRRRPSSYALQSVPASRHADLQQSS